ncbi:MAG: hypothetical protein ACOX37_01735 [Bacillota bacterium]
MFWLPEQDDERPEQGKKTSPECPAPAHHGRDPPGLDNYARLYVLIFLLRLHGQHCGKQLKA